MYSVESTLSMGGRRVQSFLFYDLNEHISLLISYHFKFWFPRVLGILNHAPKQKEYKFLKLFWWDLEAINKKKCL